MDGIRKWGWIAGMVNGCYGKNGEKEAKIEKLYSCKI
jgi:hypothetical protein